MLNMQTRALVVCGVPYEMRLVEGGVLLSQKSGCYGISRRIMFEHFQGRWYMIEMRASFNKVPLPDLVRIAELLKQHVSVSKTGALAFIPIAEA